MTFLIRASVRSHIHTLVRVCLAALLTSTAFGWSVGHNDSAWLAATISPEPFKSNPALCQFAGYPDAMQDHAVGHGRDGYMLRLFTFEAIDALRANDLPKALFFASAATHYLTDRACIAHSRAWYHREGDPWTKFLSKRCQSVVVPHERKDVYYEHLQGTAKDTVLSLPEPEYCVGIWRKYAGSTNAYFDSLPSVKGYVTPDLLRKPTDWTFTDFDQYARWYATFIALDMLDPQSIGTGQLRLRDAIGMKAVCVEELINGAAQDAAYFGYLATAMNAVVEPSLAKLIPEHDKLLKLAEADAVVFIPQNASWPVERAAHVLGMELLRATRRLATLKDLAPPEKSPSAFVMRVTTERLPAELGARNAILVIPPSSDDWARASDAPPVPSDKSGIIAARQTGGKTHIVLRGATQQDTLYLVDYLLDLAWSPLHGRWPAERAVSVLQELWSGWKLIRDLGGMSGAAAVAYARKLPYHHNQTRAEDATKYAAALKQGVHSPASEEEWWSYFLLEIPLPDGRRVADLIEKGADYSALIEIVSR